MSATPFIPSPEAHAVTYGPFHHFFGYYDKSPWDASGRWILGMRSRFMDRPPAADDVLEIGVIDTEERNAWCPLAETQAWNWQQGCMLQWLGDGRRGDLIFNDRAEGRFISRVLNLHTGAERVLDRPVYGLNRQGTHAASLSFARLQHQRPGYGYAGLPDPWEHDPTPEDDGIWSIDLATGESRLILSLADAAAFQPLPEFAGKTHRFNHLQFSHRADHFGVLHRWKSPDEEVGHTRLLTLDLDGANLRCLSTPGFFSHYDWHGPDSLVAWTEEPGRGPHYFYFNERDGSATPIGEKLFTTDGHCSFSPDGRWMLTDTYPDARQMRTLMLYHWPTGQRIDLGEFYAPKVYWEIRCDLHPRWSRDGRHICLDSVHEGHRQMYVINISEILASHP
jgi:hypothetical protein